jgi:hypothetical protein
MKVTNKYHQVGKLGVNYQNGIVIYVDLFSSMLKN